MKEYSAPQALTTLVKENKSLLGKAIASGDMVCCSKC